MFVAMKGINLSLKQEAPATFDPSIDALSIHSAMPEPDSGAFNPNPKPYNLNPRSSHPNPRP